jgi:hypothetical protein
VTPYNLALLLPFGLSRYAGVNLCSTLKNAGTKNSVETVAKEQTADDRPAEREHFVRRRRLTREPSAPYR